MSSPPDRAVAERMNRALSDAARHLPVCLPGTPRWGVDGRTLSSRVEHRGATPGWLRLLALPQVKADSGDRLWEGAVDAARFDGKVTKPRLLAVHDAFREGMGLRAELSEYVAEPACSPTPVVYRELELTDMWWTSLRRDLDTIAATATDRQAVRQEWIDCAVPRYTGRPAPQVTSWTCAHADLHPANLTTGTPVILDWEAHGMALAGYDAAVLWAHCLLAPVTVDRVRREFADLLGGEAGRVAQLVVAAELLQCAERGHYTDLVAPLRDAVQSLP
ncbi:hypothetical protein V2W30_40080 (plasmid) [Streptomyces sp. Q6]|uniref:Uncharacterized protein n=1 Tax=Streptomyces citrinus TaxID=3118173 RepID=A0ACD5AQ90_9ACTN